VEKEKREPSRSQGGGGGKAFWNLCGGGKRSVHHFFVLEKQERKREKETRKTFSSIMESKESKGIGVYRPRRRSRFGSPSKLE